MKQLMRLQEDDNMKIEAELILPQAALHIVRFSSVPSRQTTFRRDDRYWLDLCLTPRPEKTVACYPAHWGPHRYERIGDLFLVPPGQDVHIRNDSGMSQVSLVCELQAGLLDDWVEEPIDWTGQRLEASLDITSPYVRNALFRLTEEVRHPGFGNRALAELIIGQIAIELGRYCTAVADGPNTGGLAGWRLRLIEERLTDEGAVPTLRELASICNASIRQLTRGFRASRGCSIGDYIAQKRIEHAKRLLATDMSIKAIGYTLGFTSSSSFSYAFRRATGSTPRQFRQRQLRRPA